MVLGRDKPCNGEFFNFLAASAPFYGGKELERETGISSFHLGSAQGLFLL